VISSKTKVVIGYAVAAACLAWVLHDVRWETLWTEVGQIRWSWVVLAVVFDVLSYVCQGKRWALLLRHMGEVPLLKATQAVYAGLFVSEMLPLRAGEVVRAWLGASWMNTKMTMVIPTILVERFFDAIWLALAVGLTVFFVPLPKYLMDAEGVLAAIVFLATGLFAFVVLRRRGPTGGQPGRVRLLLDSLSAGITEIGRSNWLHESFGMSALFLLLQIMAYCLMIWAYGIRLSVWHGAAVYLIVRLGTAAPGAPANLGTYQFFTVVGLTLVGIDKTTATGFSIVVFLILTIPLWTLGSLAFARAGLTLKEVRLL
jgi:hypothetical protein